MHSPSSLNDVARELVHHEYYESPLTEQQLVTLANTDLADFLAQFSRLLSQDALRFIRDRITAAQSNSEVAFYLSQSLPEERAKQSRAGAANRNDRFATMQRLLADSSDEGYFSVSNMRLRDPQLYHEFIGQYQDDHNAREKSQQNRAAERFRGVLFDVKSDLDEEYKKRFHDGAAFSRNMKVHERLYYNDALNQAIEKQSKAAAADHDEEDKDEPESETITDEERKELEDEFLDIMKQRFLNGEDAEFFDYAEQRPAASLGQTNSYLVIDSSERDLEDAYFEENDDDNDDIEDTDIEMS